MNYSEMIRRTDPVIKGKREKETAATTDYYVAAVVV